MTLSVGRLCNVEWIKRMLSLEESISNLTEVLIRDAPGRTEKNHEKLIHNDLFLGRVSKRLPPQ
jgi:hypothetical protein